MKCRGIFKFKEIVKKEAGSFTNGQGQLINYPESYVLKVDEKTEKGIQERIFKLDKDSTLVPKLQKIGEYTDIVLDFVVIFYGNVIRIVPTEIVKQ